MAKALSSTPNGCRIEEASHEECIRYIGDITTWGQDGTLQSLEPEPGNLRRLTAGMQRWMWWQKDSVRDVLVCWLLALALLLSET